ncbi:nuclear transport factor 2 family protein [Caballeronia sp. LZ001]|uniref:nuclear transport factor 2 family protein n=1 Tax=Caballeronia sp. LZ001 TaxID=3038553 RepID=UPI0028659345|nr:nuclear transport factor 2 family protein [Caballeronia sp. LZ001]MDR5804847.1 nuclear transport factor 2 family protein [Caballeronia sp. LZ001]
MPTCEQVAEAAHRYAQTLSAGDREGWLKGFTDCVEVIEPADSAPRRGRSIFAGIFDDLRASGRRLALKPLRIIVNGNEAAVYMSVRIFQPDGNVVAKSVIEIFQVANDGRISRLRTYMDCHTGGSGPRP